MVTVCYRSLVFLVLYGLSFGASACESETAVVDATPEEIANFFFKEDKQVVTFVGYSGAQYQDESEMLHAAEEVLAEFEPSRTLVNIGATSVGIGAVYALAKHEGFVTTGIVSTQAREYAARLSPCVDYVFYVEDASWGGFIDDQRTLSPTSTAMVQGSDVMIAIGGGAVARDELIAARLLGKDVRYIPADMNHQVARDKAKEKSLPAPKSFTGAIGDCF